jgi:hypothetical protein
VRVGAVLVAGAPPLARAASHRSPAKWDLTTNGGAANHSGRRSREC